MEKVRKQAENGWPGQNCTMQGYTRIPTLSVEGVGERDSSDTPFLPSIRPCTLDARHPEEESHCLELGTCWTCGETPRGTYRGTGRCNQGQGLCNSGWRRSWLGTLGNLMGQSDGVRNLALSGGQGQLGSEGAHSLPTASLSQISLRFPVDFYAPSPKLGTAFIILQDLSSAVSGRPGEGLTVQTRKLRHRELKLDKNNTTLLPNSSHPGSHLLLLPISHTAFSSCLYAPTCCFSRVCRDQTRALAHNAISARGTHTRPLRPCYAGVRQVSPLSARRLQFLLRRPAIPLRVGILSPRRRKPSVSAHGALEFRFRSD